MVTAELGTTWREEKKRKKDFLRVFQKPQKEQKHEKNTKSKFSPVIKVCSTGSLVKINNNYR